MGLGSTAKKIQMVSDRAEQMYRQVQELQERIFHLEEEVDDTHDTVKRMDHQLVEQRALLIEMAEVQGLDADSILAEAAIDEAEEEATETEDADAEAAESDDQTDDEGSDGRDTDSSAAPDEEPEGTPAE